MFLKPKTSHLGEHPRNELNDEPPKHQRSADDQNPSNDRITRFTRRPCATSVSSTSSPSDCMRLHGINCTKLRALSRQVVRLFVQFAKHLLYALSSFMPPK